MYLSVIAAILGNGLGGFSNLLAHPTMIAVSLPATAVAGHMLGNNLGGRAGWQTILLAMVASTPLPFFVWLLDFLLIAAQWNLWHILLPLILLAAWFVLFRVAYKVPMSMAVASSCAMVPLSLMVSIAAMIGTLTIFLVGLGAAAIGFVLVSLLSDLLKAIWDILAT